MTHGGCLVLWRGDTTIAGASDMVALLRSLGKRVIFVVRRYNTGV
jgi:ribonucleotide monophosphatase NagD (HAD superfamily)